LVSSLSLKGSLFHKVTLLDEVVFSTIVTLLTRLLVRVIADTHTSVVSTARDRLLSTGLGFGFSGAVIVGGCNLDRLLESFLFGFFLLNFLGLDLLLTGNIYNSTDRSMITVRLRVVRFINNEVACHRLGGCLESNLSGSLLDIVVSLFGGFFGFTHVNSNLIFVTEAFFL
jgi:hypothetical protein